MDCALSGVIIRETLINDSDKLLTVITDSRGKITLKAKGVKNIKNRNSAGTQIFTYSDFELTERSGRFTLKTAYPKQSFFGLRNDVLRYALACYLADAAGYVTAENNDETQVLRLILNAFYALSEKTDIPLSKIKAAFELKLMSVCGFMPELDCCACCSDDVQTDGKLYFSFSHGGIICDRCKSMNGTFLRAVRIERPVIQAMKTVSESDIKKFLAFSLDEPYRKDFCTVCESYLLHQTERGYETLKIYKNMIRTIQNNGGL